MVRFLRTLALVETTGHFGYNIHGRFAEVAFYGECSLVV